MGEGEGSAEEEVSDNGFRRQLLRYWSLFSIVVLIGSLAVFSQDTGSDRPAPEAYNVPEAYEIYAAILPNEWTWKDAHSPALLIQMETTAYGMCIHPDKESEDLLGPVIANYNEVNRKIWLLQRNFDIEKPYDLVPKKDIRHVLENDAVAGVETFREEHPRYVGSLELSAVGFNPEKTVAVVYVGHDCGWLCGGGGFRVLEKKDGKWQALKWKGSSCAWFS